MGTYSGLSALLMLFLFALHAVAYTAFWVRAEAIRRGARPAGSLPSSAGLLWGWAMFSYVWTDRHLDAKDRTLSGRVIVLRVTFAVFIVSGVILQLTSWAT